MLKRLSKIVLIGCLSLAVAAVAAHFVWKYSGTGQWQLHRKSDGITIYSLKKPGSTKKMYKGVARVHSTLPIAMAASMDDAVYTEICKWAGCVDAKVFERAGERQQFIKFRMDYPLNFQPREFVALQRLSMVPGTNTLRVDITAAPDKLPRNECCIRVEHLNNSWLYKPVGNGDIEIEYVVDEDDGGFFPYVLANLGAPEFVGGILGQMQHILDTERQLSPNPQFRLLAEK